MADEVRHAEVILSLTGQTFAFDPPEGRASGTPTVQVFSSSTDDDGTAESATTGACSVDSVNTTLDGAISSNVSTAVLTSGTGVTRGNRYLLTDTDGNAEWVEVRGVSGVNVTFRHPTVNSYATASTFVGCRISIAVNATWVADKSNLTDVLGADWRTAAGATADTSPGAAGYRLRWAYTVGGIATIGVSYADLVRYQAKNLVTALDVDRLFPGWIDRLSSDYREDQGAALIEEAWQAIKMDAMGDAQLVRRIRDTQVLADLVKYRANVLGKQAEVMAGRADPASYDLASNLYERRYSQLIREPKVSVDQTGGGSNAAAVTLPAWVR